MTTSDFVTYAPDCPRCGQRLARPVAWLRQHAAVPCVECGGTINLKAGRHASAVRELARACEKLDGPAKRPRRK